jgi:hypothetical protein
MKTNRRSKKQHSAQGLSGLPTEIIVHIFMFIPLSSLGVLSSVNSYMLEIAQCDTIWKGVAEAMFAASVWRALYPQLLKMYQLQPTHRSLTCDSVVLCAIVTASAGEIK